MSRPPHVQPTLEQRQPGRWRMLSLLWFVYFCFGLTSISIPPLVTPITKDLGISYGQMGIVLGVWQLVVIATASPIGALTDRLGVRRALGIGLIIVLISMVGRALAVNFATLLLAVALFGFGGPVISIGAPKLVAEWFGSSERGIAAGIYGTASVAGSAFALATAGGVVLPLTGTWRGIGPVYGAIIGAIVLAWWLLSLESPAPRGTRAQQRADPPERAWAVVKTVLAITNVRVILLVAVGLFLIEHGLSTWIPTLLQEKGMSLAQAGMWAAAGMAPMAFGAFFVPTLTRPGARVWTVSLLLALTSATTAGLALATGAPLIAFLMLAAVVRRPIVSILTLLLMETPGVGARRTGTATGLYYAAGEAGGFGGPLLLGLILDYSGSLSTGMMMLAGVSISMALAILYTREPSRHSSAAGNA